MEISKISNPGRSRDGKKERLQHHTLYLGQRTLSPSLRTDSLTGRTKLCKTYEAGLALFLDNLFAVEDIQTLLGGLPVDLLTFEVVNLNVKNAVDGDAVNA